CLRDDLNQKAHRRMVVLNPLKLTITNYDQLETLKAANHPKEEARGHRELPMSSTLWIDRDDFMEDPPKKYFRLKPGGEVRLRNSYIVKCEEVIKDDKGEVIELKATIDPNTLGKNPEGRKVKGIIHWVSADKAVPVTVRLYDRLFNDANPGGHKEKSFIEFLNPNSLEVVKNCYAEPAIQSAKPGESFQFERVGYFCLDQDSTDGDLIFNRSVSLRDNWK
ncbi:MAG: glutamine--tRNA ligase, partial [Pseudomonadota bacterium]